MGPFEALDAAEKLQRRPRVFGPELLGSSGFGSFGLLICFEHKFREDRLPRIKGAPGCLKLPASQVTEVIKPDTDGGRGFS